MAIRITQNFYFKNMKTKLLEKEIKYEGFQLAPHWIYKNFKIQGDATVAFIGECDVKLDEMVDIEDVINNEPIYSKLMLSFIPSGEKQLTTAYYPYSFVMEKGTGYRSPNHPLTPSIMMTKRHTFFEFTPAIAVIAIEGNNGVGQFNGGNLFTNKFTAAA